MWKSFYEKDNLAYLKNDKNRLIYEVNKDNLEQILITKNNIEEIDKKINRIKNIDKKLTIFWILKSPLLALLFSSIFAIPIPFTEAIILKIILCLGATKFIVLGINSLTHFIKLYKKTKLSNKLQLELLLEEYNNEKQKLKSLEDVSKSKTVEKVQYKDISRSEMIKFLEHKQGLIKNYCENKKTIISLYNDGTMNKLGELYNYNENDIKFINLIIQEELKDKEIKIKERQKIKYKN